MKWYNVLAGFLAWASFMVLGVWLLQREGNLKSNERDDFVSELGYDFTCYDIIILKDENKRIERGKPKHRIHCNLNGGKAPVNKEDELQGKLKYCKQIYFLGFSAERDLSFPTMRGDIVQVDSVLVNSFKDELILYHQGKIIVQGSMTANLNWY
jgi:hypothetical protein